MKLSCFQDLQCNRCLHTLHWSKGRNEEVTDAQLTCLHYKVQSGLPTLVDMAF